MKVLIFCVILIAAQAGVLGIPDKSVNCGVVKCTPQEPPKCPPGTVLTRRSPTPGNCCNLYECKKEVIDCSNVFCAMLLPPTCPEGTVPTKSRKIVSAGDCCRPFECEPVCYTQWFDRDNPSGTGDHETLNELRKENPGKICAKPLNIQAMTLTGVPAEKTGQVFLKYNTLSGFACLNSQQTSGCLDYKVRFGCPCDA